MIEENEVCDRLSVLLVTYNHEKYISKAMESLFGQIVEGPIELVIADDGSSDKTLDIIRTHEGKDHRFYFKYLDSNTNLGVTRNYQRGFSSCTGKYVAILEGDDYWISSLKLQRQKQFLDNFCGCDLCSVNYYIYEEDSARFYPRTAIGGGCRFLRAQDLIEDNLIGNFSTCMYRKSALDKLPQTIFNIKSYDWIVNICIARYSLIGFIEEPLSVYRLHAQGVWTQKTQTSKLTEQLEMLPAYDELTNHIFNYEFETLGSRLQHLISASCMKDSVAGARQPVSKMISTLIEYTPPIFLTIVKAILPPKIKQILLRVLIRGNE